MSGNEALGSGGAHDAQAFGGGGRTLFVALIAAALGLAGFVVALLLDPTQALAGYLIAYFFAVTVVIGLLAFVMGAYVMGALWPTTVRRMAEAGFAVLPLLLLLYLPLLWSARLYPWAHPERISDAHIRALVLHKAPVMNAPFVFGRAVAFLVLWTLIGEFLRRGSLRMDRPAPPDGLKPRLVTLSALALPLVGVTGTFAAFDWIMSLSPDFYSTMYGLYCLAGGFVAAIGLLAILTAATQRAGFLAFVRRSHWYALGRLLFAFLIFWAYTGFFQYMLIWIANKPLEARFFIERIRPADRWTSEFLIWGHFVVPWLILLSYAVKRRRATVTAMGAWLLACHYVDVHWLVGSDRGSPHPWLWQDAPPLVLICGLATAVGIWRQRGHLLAPRHDPDFVAGTHYESR